MNVKNLLKENRKEGTIMVLPYRTVLTQGNKGGTTQIPCVKIVRCGELLAVSFGGSQSVISLSLT